MIPTGVYDPDDPHDAWGLLGTGYAVDKFYCRASDSNGHSSLVHVKMSPNTHAMLNRLVNDPALPYQSHADVLRDSLTHRIKFILEAQKAASDIGKADAELWAMWRDVLFAGEIEQAQRSRAERQRSLEMLWSEVQTLMGERQVDRAYEWVDRYEDMVLEYEDVDDRRIGAQHVEQMRQYIASAKDGRIAVLPSTEWRNVK